MSGFMPSYLPGLEVLDLMDWVSMLEWTPLSRVVLEEYCWASQLLTDPDRNEPTRNFLKSQNIHFHCFVAQCLAGIEHLYSLFFSPKTNNFYTMLIFVCEWNQIFSIIICLLLCQRFYNGNSYTKIDAIFMPICTENGFCFLHCDWPPF